MGGRFRSWFRRWLGWSTPQVAWPLPAVCAVLAVVGVWVAEALRPWIPAALPWWVAAVAAGAGALWRGRTLWPAVPTDPARPGGWLPAGGAATRALLGLCILSLAAAHYLDYVGRLGQTIPAGEAAGSGVYDLVGRVVGWPEVRDGQVRFPVAVVGLTEGGPGGIHARLRRGRVKEGLRWGTPWGGLVEVRVPDPPPGDGLDTPYRPFRPALGEWVSMRAWVRRPGPARNPGAFSERRYYESRGIGAIARVPHVRHIRRLPGGRDGGAALKAAGLALRWRRQVENFMQSSLPREPAGLLLSMMFGDRHQVPPDLQEAFRRGGLAHLLSVSGLHVGFVSGLVAMAAALMRWPQGVTVAGGGALIAFYVIATGARPPAMRAGVMALLGLVAMARARRRDLPTAAALAALSLVAWRPSAALDLSFQLSFAAALAIGAAWTGLSGFWGRLGGGMWRRMAQTVGGGIAISVAAQLATGPLLLRAFGELSVLGPLANVAAVPLAGLAVPAGLLGGTLAGTLAPALAQLLGGPLGTVAALPLAWAGSWLTTGAGGLVQALAAWARWVAALSVDPLQGPPPAWPLVAGWYGLLVALGILVAPAPPRVHLYAADWRRRKRPLLLLVGAALLATTLLAVAVPAPPVEVYFFDVGQGAAALLRTRSGAAVLIDGGRGALGAPETDGFDAGRRVVVPALRALGVHRLAAVINTHPHEDHVGGLVDVVRAMPVGEWWDPGPAPEWAAEVPPSYTRALQELEARGIPRRTLRAGHTIHLGDGVTLHVLHPPPALLQGTGADVNNNSLVLALRYRDASWLFTGDLEVDGQRAAMASAGGALGAAGFQVPHHGAASSLYRPFWRQVAPEVAVVQVGHNNFGQPAGQVLDTLGSLGAEVYRTDLHGAVRVWTWGRGWRVETWIP